MVAVRRVLAFGVVVAALLGTACGSSTTTSTAPSTIDRCSVSVRASNTSMPANGGSGQIAVTTARECAWTATSEAAWLTLDGRSSGQGDGSVGYRVTPNGDPVTRRGAIVLNNQRTEINQAAADCGIRLGAASAEFGPAGGEGSVRVEASSQMCSWTASSEADWISITSRANGTGPGSIAFTVAGTSGPPRTGTIRVADQRFSVTQSEGCTYAISPVQGSVAAAGGSGDIAVTTGPGCPWTAHSNASWISISRGASGSGPGNVSFDAAPLEGPPRAGTLVVAGRTFTLEQGAGCSYQVAPLAHSVSAAGGAITVNVQAAPGCPWNASSGVTWITISSAESGSGSGTVTLAVAPASGGARTGTATVAGQTVTVDQADGCSYAIQPESESVPAAGGTVAVDVAAGPGCAWTAASNEGWISITDGASGSGNGTVRFSVAAAAGEARAGTLTIAGRTFTVNQGQGCSATVSPASTTVEASGGRRTFDVRTADGCNWTASSAESWITIASGESGSGNGTVHIEVAVNTAGRRTGTVIAAGQTFAVEQESGCAITLGASGQSVPAEGGTGTVDVGGAPGCSWSAVEDQPWITITGGDSGSGPGTVAFSVAANSGPQRSGAINIGGQTFTISQAGACTFAIEPNQHAASASGGSVTVNVSASPGCAWTAGSSTPWITISDGEAGSGDGTVRLSIEANAGPARSGTATIADANFTVDQPSGCTYELRPDSRSADEDGETDSFDVAASSAQCSWSAASTVPWILINGENGGTGSGRVDYTVEPNTTGDRRRGTIVVEGQVFTVNQQDDDN